ncbi:MAG: hypothetical protein AB1847_04080 [bacterium]
MNCPAIEHIFHENSLLAIIIHSDFHKEGIEFFTPDDYSQQIAYMNRPAGYRVTPHIHNKLQREVFYTQEVLFMKRGMVKVDFYDERRNHVDTRILKTGDVILLASGGHGFEMIEQSEIIEVKQGPYAGDNDKTRFSA